MCLILLILSTVLSRKLSQLESSTFLSKTSGVRHLEKIKIRALLVYGPDFGVAPRVTYNGYAPLRAP